MSEFVAAVKDGTPMVKQMLMGGGKTTVVGPLLSLLLADGERLVVQTMPPALLEQSMATLRATFGAVLLKRIYTLEVDRSSETTWHTADKLDLARKERGVVLCSAQSLKALQLKLIEKMVKLQNAKRDLDASPSMANDIRALVKITAQFRSGLVIMDEVDLILHPLKSEVSSAGRASHIPPVSSAHSHFVTCAPLQLNFPIGERHPLDFSPERWTCALHCVSAPHRPACHHPASRGTYTSFFSSLSPSSRALPLLPAGRHLLPRARKDVGQL